MVMQKVDTANDYRGRPITTGDTVAILSDNTSARVAEVATEGDQAFVRLRPLHQPYGKGVWHAADAVVWLSTRKAKGADAAAKAKGRPATGRRAGAAEVR